MDNKSNKKRHTVIVGAGFGGIRCLKDLMHDTSRRITLVDRNDYNFFPPLIYQVAGGFLPPSDISYPLRKFIAGNDHVRYRQGTLVSVNPTAKTITLDSGVLSYDELVIATGAEVNYFGNTNLEKHSLPMKKLTDALAIRNTLLKQMDIASRLPADERAPYLTIVIAGGGPSGVELAGVLGDVARNAFEKEYPELLGSGAKILMITGDPVLLKPFSEQSQAYARKEMENYGIELMFNKIVKNYDGETVTLASGETIASKTLIWTAGVTCHKLDGFKDEDYAHGNRLKVNPQLCLPDYEDIYVIGDYAMCTSDSNYPKGHPQLGQVANEQGAYLADLLKKSDKANAAPFAFKNHGNMAMIGRGKAVADTSKHMEGFIAWAAWAVVHVWKLNTAKNRIATMWDWMISFITGNQSFRMSFTPSGLPPQVTNVSSDGASEPTQMQLDDKNANPSVANPSSHENERQSPNS